MVNTNLVGNFSIEITIYFSSASYTTENMVLGIVKKCVIKEWSSI